MTKILFAGTLLWLGILAPSVSLDHTACIGAIMSASNSVCGFVSRLSMNVFAQESIEAHAAQWRPEPGNPGHQTPPPGWMCSPDALEASHRCACHRQRICEPQDDGEGGTIPPGGMREDPTCTVFCHMSHCACPVEECCEEH